MKLNKLKLIEEINAQFVENGFPMSLIDENRIEVIAMKEKYVLTRQDLSDYEKTDKLFGAEDMLKDKVIRKLGNIEGDWGCLDYIAKCSRFAFDVFDKKVKELLIKV